MTFGSPPPRRARRVRADAERSPPRSSSSGCSSSLVLILAQVWTEVLWYQPARVRQRDPHRVGHARDPVRRSASSSWRGAVCWSLNFGYRSRPVYAPSTQEQANLDQYREAIEPLRRLVMIVGPAVLGLFAGAAASQQWQTDPAVDARRDRSAKTDPQYGIDLGLLRVHAARRCGSSSRSSWRSSCSPASARWSRTTSTAGCGSAASAAARRARRRRRASSCRSSRPCSCCSSPASYWLDRYSILTKTGRKFAGASYTDVQRRHPVEGDPGGHRVIVAVAVHRHRGPRQLAAARRSASA